MVILSQLVTSFIASSGFGVIFNAPRKSLLQCGFIGMIGWMLYFELVQYGWDVVPATVLASILVGAVGQILAKVCKTPILIFIVSGIIPLVPGGTSYDAMRHFVENDYFTAVQLSAKVMLLSGGIAIGLMFSEVVKQIIQKWNPKQRLAKH